MSKLYILTLSWNGQDKLEKLYPSLFNSLNDIDYQWLIKDNGSKDNTVETIANWNNNNIKCISYKNNLQNFSEGVNLLFQEASPRDSDLVLLLNNDVIFNDYHSLKDMIKIIKTDKEVGVVGARLLYPNSNLLQHAGVVFDTQHRAPMHFRAKAQSDSSAEKNRQFQAITGAVLLTKAEYFKNSYKNNNGMLGLDNNFIWAFDDVDLCLSIKYNMQKKIVYCGKTNISHEESASLKKNPVNKLFMPHNINYFKEKWNSKYFSDKDQYSKEPNYNLYKGI